jgi:hypothetical protein
MVNKTVSDCQLYVLVVETERKKFVRLVRKDLEIGFEEKDNVAGNR